MSGALDALCRLDVFRELLALLTPGELAVVALVLDGESYTSAGRLLGLDRRTVHMRMARARRRIARLMPEATRQVAA